jgi:hypothetical protein
MMPTSGAIEYGLHNLDAFLMVEEESLEQPINLPRQDAATITDNIVAQTASHAAESSVGTLAAAVAAAGSTESTPAQTPQTPLSATASPLSSTVSTPTPNPNQEKIDKLNDFMQNKVLNQITTSLSAAADGKAYAVKAMEIISTNISHLEGMGMSRNEIDSFQQAITGVFKSVNNENAVHEDMIGISKDYINEFFAQRPTYPEPSASSTTTAPPTPEGFVA